MGTHVDFNAAHYYAPRFKELASMGSVGIVFHACCLLETTTSCFLYRMMPIASGSGSTQTGNGSLASEADCRLPRTLSLPAGHKRYHASHNPHNTQNSPHRLKRVGPHVFGSTLETPLRIVHFSQTLVRGKPFRLPAELPCLCWRPE